MTKERPILFSGPMVRAIREGRKTMTRRIVCASMEDHPEAWSAFTVASTDRKCRNTWSISKPDPKGSTYGTPPGTSSGRATELWRGRCRYGAPGDRLWVRETWGLFDTQPSDGPKRATVFYRATDGDRHELRHQLWRPSNLMPRWASRITLEITNVRIERLQSISASDAIGEGIEANCEDGVTYYGPYGNGHCDPREAFKVLWDSINSKRAPWSSNPWVWVIEFKDVSSNG